MLAGADPWAEAAGTAGQICVAVTSSCLLVPLSSGYAPETWFVFAGWHLHWLFWACRLLSC